jgi:hypothetical protein
MSIRLYRYLAWGVAGAFLAIVVLGMVVPRTVPRFAFLPAPAARTYCSKTMGQSVETWYRAGPFWAHGAEGHFTICEGSSSN